MLIFNQLKTNENFSDTERKIADYILENAKEVTNMTIQDLAKATYSSPSTISRFCLKVNADGFSEFKVKLASEIGSHSPKETRIEDDLPFTQNESPKEIIENIYSLNLQSLNDTYNHLDFDQLQRVAIMMHQSPHLYLYGTGQSLILAQDFQYKLYRIKRDCHLETQVGFQHSKAYTQPLDSVAMIISYYGNNINNLRIIKYLHENNIPTILITGPNKNALCAYATEVIHVPAQEQLMKKMASYSSRTAIQLVLDFIYALMFSLDYENYQKIVEGLI
ncbi:MurR/RpiR family transcriptional regulator [Erysipelothrix urinaevulpis]|uniref:MurR/RpiR family transcriptional regulator n=1 Tax=Erysipelothrix urinaevulpis TaxID=2683717 RepID=UPI00135BBB58|nr:MurR/RpiR family transcriptional regulator [Erysipelothrix urinaevulpis]